MTLDLKVRAIVRKMARYNSASGWDIYKKKAAEKAAAETKISVETTEESASATEGETQPEEQTTVAETVTMEEIE